MCIDERLFCAVMIVWPIDVKKTLTQRTKNGKKRVFYFKK